MRCNIMKNTYINPMNRRTFTKALGGAMALPLLPMPAAATASKSSVTYLMAAAQARSGTVFTPSLLAKRFGLSAAAAHAMFARLAFAGARDNPDVITFCLSKAQSPKRFPCNPRVGQRRLHRR